MHTADYEMGVVTTKGGILSTLRPPPELHPHLWARPRRGWVRSRLDTLPPPRTGDHRGQGEGPTRLIPPYWE